MNNALWTPYGHSVPIQRHRKKFRKWIEVVWKWNKRFTSVLEIHSQTYVILQFEVFWQVVRLCSKLITCTMHGMEFRSRCFSNVDSNRISRAARFLLSSQMKVVYYQNRFGLTFPIASRSFLSATSCINYTRRRCENYMIG